MIRQPALAVVILLAACGGSQPQSSGSYSCDLRPGPMNRYTCDDYEGATDMLTVQTYQADCTNPNLHGGNAGVWATSLCDHTGALGGCRETGTGVTITVWSFPGNGNSVQNVMNTCAVAHGMFVSP